MKKTGKYRWDILVILAVLAVGGVIALALLLGGKPGRMVQVRVDGAVVRTFALDQDLVFEIEGVNGGRNLLRIENGEAWVEEASCPDGLCMGMGRISQVGQAVICLPNRVVVEVVSEDAGEEPVVDHVVG